MHVNELKTKSPQQLLKMAEDMGIENPAQLNVQQLRFAVMRVYAADKSVVLIGDGVLERMSDGFGFLRAPDSNYLAGPDDLYVSPALIKKYGLKTGDYVEGQIQAPQNESERYFALETIERVNGEDPEKLRHRISFDDMPPLYPDEKLQMEVINDTDKGRNLSARVIDLIAPTGKGQRRGAGGTPPGRRAPQSRRSRAQRAEKSPRCRAACPRRCPKEAGYPGERTRREQRSPPSGAGGIRRREKERRCRRKGQRRRAEPRTERRGGAQHRTAGKAGCGKRPQQGRAQCRGRRKGEIDRARPDAGGKGCTHRCGKGNEIRRRRAQCRREARSRFGAACRRSESTTGSDAS